MDELDALWAFLVAAVVAALIFLPAGIETRGIVGGAIAIALIGAVDDARPGGLHPLVKLAGQFAAAAIPVWCDVRVENLTLPFVDPIDLGACGYPLTLIGIVAAINLVNLPDGADRR